MIDISRWTWARIAAAAIVAGAAVSCQTAGAGADPASVNPDTMPVIVLAVTFHLGHTGRWHDPASLRPVIAEVQRIFDQSRIELRPTFKDDTLPTDGLDLMYQPRVLDQLGQPHAGLTTLPVRIHGPGNTVSPTPTGPHMESRVRDSVTIPRIAGARPRRVALPPALGAHPGDSIDVRPEEAELAVVTAHELTHALGPGHRDGAANLMAPQSEGGWRLDAKEIAMMRRDAVAKWEATVILLPHPVVLAGTSGPVKASLPLFPDVPLSLPPTPWSVGAAPALEIKQKGARGRDLFTIATHATRLRDGTIVIADARSRALQFVDAAGTFVRTVHDAGGSPSDLVDVTWVSSCGTDSVIAWDYVVTRLTIYDVGGRVLGTASLPDAGPQYVLACDDRGRMAYEGPHTRDSAPPVAGARTDVAGFIGRLVVGKPGAGTESMFDRPIPLTEIVTLLGPTGRSTGRIERPLGHVAHYCLAGDSLYVGTGEQPQVDIYRLNGTRLGGFAIDAAGRPATKPAYASAVTRLLNTAVTIPSDARRNAALAVPMPTTLPFYSNLLCDPEGLIWVVLSAAGDPDTHVRAVRADGHTVGEVTLVGDVRVFEVGVDYILGARDDPNGQQRVVLYRLRR